jgi:hypothetical protein
VTAAELRNVLAAIPDAVVVRGDAVHAGIDAAASWLGSDAALAAIAEEPYWPKWHGAWWHMVLLWELGEAARIPPAAVRAMIASVDRLLHVFPVQPGDAPPGYDPARDVMCHCGLGTIDQVLTACGVDVDRELPWVRGWYDRYQMRDGGLSCDESAYTVADECPSSMVGTVAPFEAMLRRGDSAFVARGAEFLCARELRLGSPTRHNADERAAAGAWSGPTFPRFYFYDTLRGLTALVRWSTQLHARLPLAAVGAVATELAVRAPDGVVRVARHAHAGHPTYERDAAGTWARRPETGSFALLDAVSAADAPSERLTREWQHTRRALVALVDEGLVA